MNKTMRQHSVASRLKSLALAFGITLAFASCANEEIAQNPNGKDRDANLTTFSTGDPTTRTSMESNGTFYWESGDKIWVKDDNGAWQQSSNAPTEKTASFEFKVPGKFTKSSTYKVYYPGQNGNQDQVSIAANQSQTEPNTTAHFGASGDCGMADAAWSNTKNGFAFSLDHKAAYLLFLPRTSNTILQGCCLTKVEVNSDNDITSTYTLNPTTGELTGTGTGKQIIVSTGGSGTYANGFPLTNNATSAATNGAYVVIKPGTHILKIRYWVKDVATGTEGTITKTLPSATYDQNKYYNITANLDVRVYDGDKYYMWDAQDQYWKGHEWHNGGSQPTLSQGLAGATTSNDYAKSNADSRYWNEYYPGYGVSNPATHTSCKDLPNVNEMTWYAAKGEPRWDADELWITMGHLYKGGMWFKKKANISGFNPNTAEDGTDWRTNGNGRSWSISYTLPSAADANNYFYLPALGFYRFGTLFDVGGVGFYWSSSASPWRSDCAYGLYFRSGNVYVSDDRYRDSGVWAEALQ
ncbi:hypothetical protein [Prevotella jejuni]|uniref:hypothetical protein n=1 Tax=Prevotella jejuni TaxID=1177574 RepID=UPI001C600554|nr:hypothetical protein [Prevotella jejuni]MBW4772145.1 hypothetical protein [Prevotella jejuni]